MTDHNYYNGLAVKSSILGKHSYASVKDRFNSHRGSVDRPNIKSKPSAVAERFLSDPYHSNFDMQLIPLETITTSCNLIRKARESHPIFKAIL